MFVLAMAAGIAACESMAPSTERADPPNEQPAAVRTLAPKLAAWGAAARLSSADARMEGLVAAELDRDANADALDRALRSSDAALQARAALSLARIGGPVAAETFNAWLGDGQRVLPAQVAGAIAVLAPPAGTPGDAPSVRGVWASLESRLWIHYALAEDSAVADALLLALARIGGPETMRRLVVDLNVAPSSGTADRFERGCEAAAILCTRGLSLGSAGVAALGRGLDAPQPQARRGAAYALSRCAGPSAESLAGPERGELATALSSMLSSTATEAEEALAAWRALEALGEAAESIPAGVLGSPPLSWMVEAAAVRAMGASAAGRDALVERLARVSPDDFTGPRVHVLVEALRVLRTRAAGGVELSALADLDAKLSRQLESVSDPRRRKALVLIRCELLGARARSATELDALRQCAAGVEGLPADYGAVLAVDAMLATARDHTPALLAAARSGDKAVAQAAIAGLAEVDDPAVNALLREALGSQDVGLASAAAGAIEARAVDKSRRDDASAAPLLAAVSRLKTGLAVEARVEAIAALGALARSGSEGTAHSTLSEIAKLAADPNAAVRAAARSAIAHEPALLAAFDQVPVPRGGFSPRVSAAVEAQTLPEGLRVTTSAGVFSIAFAGAPAPIAQANLAALAGAGYFDGLTFHRVVPAFVVQGGDPRGDGYGGPGYVMPCEWSNLRYERGTVGVALAGKDTGGSQIFITHGAPHHLDGRYPVVGHIVEGLEVVDAILPHDAIERVEIIGR